MPSFFLAFLACAIATFGGRESTHVARLSTGLGQSMPLLVAIWTSAIASSAIAAWLGATIAPMLFYEAKLLFAAVALLLGGLELLVLRPRAAPAEPTRSFGAIVLVLFASQLTDAARFLVLAMAVVTASPILAGTGAALGSGIVLSMAWGMGADWEARLPLARIRLAAAALLLLAGIAALLSGLGLVE